MTQNDHRLAKKRDFSLLLTHGRFVNGTFLRARVLNLAKIQNYFPKNSHPETFKKQLRFAFSVGTKISKNAVVRNRIRRRLREVIRLLKKERRIKPGYYILLLALPATTTKKYAEIKVETELLLSSAGVL